MDHEWAVEFTSRVADNVRREREEQGLSAQQVADRCTEMGQPVSRSVITNLENGRRASLAVTDLIVIAEALDVPPIALLYSPTRAGEMISVRPDGRRVQSCYAMLRFENRPEPRRGRERSATPERLRKLRELMDCEEQAKLLVWELEDSDTSVLPMTLETAELERRRDLLLARGRELRAALVELDVEVLPEPHPDLDAAYAAFQSERASKAEQRGRTRGNG